MESSGEVLSAVGSRSKRRPEIRPAYHRL